MSAYQCPKCQETARQRDQLLAAAMIVQDMKAFLMFGKVHADWLQQEVLDKHGAKNFQAMAFLAYEKAEAAIAAAAEPQPTEATT